MPSVLIELGFLSNKTEGRFLNTNSGQQMMAGAVAKAVRNYIGHLKLNTVSDDFYTSIPSKEKKIVKKKIVKQVKKKVKKSSVAVGSEIVYQVQIGASKKYIAPKSYNFKGLKNIDIKTIGVYYKYYYGNSSSFNEIKTFLKEARLAGHKEAFIVAFEKGVKISVKEALRKQ